MGTLMSERKVRERLGTIMVLSPGKGMGKAKINDTSGRRLLYDKA
jgi:hypothetical protein